MLGIALVAALMLGGPAMHGNRRVPVAPRATVPTFDAWSRWPDRLTLDVGRRRVVVRVTVDRGPIVASDRAVTVLAQRGTLAIVYDVFRSKNQGLMRCQAGHESYVRVIDLRRRRQLYSRLVSSCVDDSIGEIDDPAVTANGSRVTFDRVVVPPLIITLSDDGRYVVVPDAT